VRGCRLTSAGVPACTTRPSSTTTTAVGQRHRVDRVVRDQHGAAGELAEVAAQLGADGEPGAGVERRRAARRAAAAPAPPPGRGPAPPAGLPAGEPAGPPVAELGDAHAAQPVAGGRRAAGLPHAAGAQPEGDVVGDRQVREEQVVLEDHAEAALVGGDVHAGGDVVPRLGADGDPPAVRRQQAGEHAQQRGLAGAVGPRTASTSPSATSRSSSTVSGPRSTRTAAARLTAPPG
jgi:hypothetical protein